MITVKTILEATKAHTKMPDKFEFLGVTTDSRSIKPGELFVALKGENFDGHSYCAMALASGAAGVLVENLMDLPEDKVLIVQDTLAAYQEIAHAYRKSMKNVQVVAITGSNGKTSTKDLVAACLATKFKVIKTEANFNNEIGLPKTLLNIRPDTDIAVVEMGMRGLGQIRALKALAEPNVVVITNVGETHMELLGSLENIAKAKSEILEGLLPENTAILNGDDYYVSHMKTGAKIVTYGIITKNIVQGSEIKISETGTSFSYNSLATGARGSIDLPLFGEHNVMTDAGSAMMGIGSAKGDGGASTAAEAAIKSPLLESTIDGARGILLNITGGKELTLMDVNEACNIITDAVDPDAMIIFGATIDESLDDEIRVTVIATGIDGKKTATPGTAPKPFAELGGSFTHKKSVNSAVDNFAPPSSDIPPWIRSK